MQGDCYRAKNLKLWRSVKCTTGSGVNSGGTRTVACFQSLTTQIPILLASNLFLYQTGSNVGEALYQSYFLCVEVKDEAISWGAGDIDW